MRPEAGKRRGARPYVSTVGLVLIGGLSIFLVFQVNWHQRIRETALQQRYGGGDGISSQADDTSSSSGGSNSDGSGGSVSSSSSSSVKSVPRKQLETDFVDVQVVKAKTETTQTDRCHIEAHNEYHGAVVKWGDRNLKETPEDCCKECQETSTCNVWVYCANPAGCGDAKSPRPYKECWLKRGKLDELLEGVIGRGHPGISWTSGALYTQQQYDAYQQKLQDKKKREEERLKALKNNAELPLVYLDVAVDGRLAGRIELVLFMKESPRAAENMRVLCSGEKGLEYHLKNAYFYRIIDRFIDQTGINSNSIYGGMFKDDEGGLKLQHDRPYLLSMANGGPNTNSAHFSITVAPAHHLDGHYTIFGEAVSGFDVIEKVNALSRGQPNNELLHSNRAQIIGAGQLRKGTYRPPPEALESASAAKASA